MKNSITKPHLMLLNENWEVLTRLLSPRNLQNSMLEKKKGKKKSKSTRQISKLRHALAIKNYPDEDERDFNLVEKYHNLFQAITQSTKTLVNCDRATLWLADYEHPNGPTLFSRISPKMNDETITISCQLREGVVGECVSAEKVLNIPDAYKYPLFNPKVDRRTGYKTRSILCVPIRGKRKHEVLGAIQLINHFVVEKEPVFREDGTVEKEIEKRHFVPFDEKQEMLVSLIIRCCRNEILKYYNRNINGMSARLPMRRNSPILLRTSFSICNLSAKT